jgi:hypothetical protein
MMSQQALVGQKVEISLETWYTVVIRMVMWVMIGIDKMEVTEALDLAKQMLQRESKEMFREKFCEQ